MNMNRTNPNTKNMIANLNRMNKILKKCDKDIITELSNKSSWDTIFNNYETEINRKLYSSYFYKNILNPLLHHNVITMFLIYGWDFNNILMMNRKFIPSPTDLRDGKYSKYKVQPLKDSEVEYLTNFVVHNINQSNLDSLYDPKNPTIGGADHLLIDYYLNSYKGNDIGVFPISTIRVKSMYYIENMFIHGHLLDYKVGNNITKILMPILVPSTYPGWIETQPRYKRLKRNGWCHMVLVIIDIKNSSIELYDHNNSHHINGKNSIYIDILETIKSGLMFIKGLEDIIWNVSVENSPFNELNDNGDCVIFVMRHCQIILNGSRMIRKFDYDDRLKFRIATMKYLSLICGKINGKHLV